MEKEVFKYKVDNSTQKMDVNVNCKEHVKLLQSKHDVNKKVIFNAKNDVKSEVLSADRSDNVKSGQDDHDWKYRHAMWRLNYKRKRIYEKMKNAEPWTSVEMDLVDYESGVNEFVMKYKDVANCDILGWKKRILFTKTDVRSYVSSKPKIRYVSKEVKSRPLFTSSKSPDLEEPDLSKIGDDLIERLAKLRFGQVKKNIKARVKKFKLRELSSNHKSCRDSYMQIESKEKAVDVQDAKTNDDVLNCQVTRISPGNDQVLLFMQTIFFLLGTWLNALAKDVACCKEEMKMIRCSARYNEVSENPDSDLPDANVTEDDIDVSGAENFVNKDSTKPCWCRSFTILDMQLFRKAVCPDQDLVKEELVALSVATQYATHTLYEKFSFG